MKKYLRFAVNFSFMSPFSFVSDSYKNLTEDYTSSCSLREINIDNEGLKNFNVARLKEDGDISVRPSFLS